MTRVRCLLLASLVTLAVLAIGSYALAGDPYLQWYTVETPHFRVHYPSGLEEHAQQIANIAEKVRQRLIPELGWQPKRVVDILLTDDTDTANGSARVIPYNLVRLHVTAPEDMAALNDYDDWLLLLFTHEDTHIHHIGNVTGLPALVNALLGPTYTPNQAQPKWIIEGWAVYTESKFTGGGRLRSSLYDMFMRADVIEDRIHPIDQVSSTPRSWPGGTLWYLYGGKFMEWIATTYGEDTLAAVSSDYGSNILVWGINRSVRRATGLTYPELWKGWVAHLKREYADQLAAVERRGIREGTRLTHHGQIVSSPRFVPACARHGHEALLYHASDGHRTTGLYRLDLLSRDRPRDRPKLQVRSQSQTFAFDSACNIVYDSVAPSRRRYDFVDLFRQPAGTRSPRGIEGTRERLTTGRRAAHPDISPAGRQIAYVTNRAGTRTLRLADYDSGGGISNERALVRSARYEQAFTPRFSPDGRHLAYSAWTRGGYRDIRVVDVATGKFFELFHDRAMDQQPTWSADGRTLYFTSDRTGIPNVYAFDLDQRRLWQVTNVRTGAYMPEVTPDGLTLFYVGYTSKGFDLFAMPLSRDTWLPALPYVDRRPGPRPRPLATRWPVRRYQPLRTLRPTAYEFETGPGTFGQALTVSTSGSDASEHHAISAAITADTEEGLPSIAVNYAYNGLPFSLYLNPYRRAAPRTSYRVDDLAPRFVEYQTGMRTGLSFYFPRSYDQQSISIEHTAAYYHGELPVESVIDPYARVPEEPYRGFYASLAAQYSYSNAQQLHFSIGNERGMSLSLGTEYAGPELGSETTLTALTGRVRGYIPLFWARHHVLALALSGGTSAGTYPRRGLFYTGGFVDTPLVEAFQDGAAARAFVLRGYKPQQFVGSRYALWNTEYRFPISYLERGVSTLPVFIRSIAGALFMDYGGAFRAIDRDDPLDSFQLGLGAELWFDVTVGYYASNARLRLGYARGTDSDALPLGQAYFVATSTF